MGTVLIVKFSDDKTKFDWVHDCGPTAHAEDVDVDTLLYAQSVSGDVKTGLIVPCSVCNVVSVYPMSGGPISQQLHRNFLEQKSLGDVQTDATERGISTAGKTQDELIALIIQDECIKTGVPYLL